MDEVLVETRCEPVIIFRELLIPLMTSSGFELMFDSSDEKRYHTGFVWRRRYVDTDISSTTYGTTQTMELRVDVIGIPIGSSYLILHGILIGTQIDDATDIKLKIRCSLRNNSLTDIYAKSNPMFFRSSYTTLEEAELTTLSDYKEYLRVKIQTEFVCKLISMVSLRLDELPFEIKLKILSYLPLKSISSMSQVSTTWREIALDEQLWKLLVKKYFPDIYDRRVNGKYRLSSILNYRID